jgi:hypothetical protein
MRKKSNPELLVRIHDLATEINGARLFHFIYCGLVDLTPEYQNEMFYSHVFWHVTITSLHDETILRLSRIYDKNKHANSLFNLLTDIKANPHSQELERLSDINYSRFHSDKYLQEHLEKFDKEKYPLVGKLMHWRHNVIAHNGVDSLPLKKPPISKSYLHALEMKILLDQAIQIFNYHFGILRVTEWYDKTKTKNDYKHCLKLIRLGIQKNNETLKDKSISANAFYKSM